VCANLSIVTCSNKRGQAVSVDAIERLEDIRAEIEVHGRVRVPDLAARFGVSEMTVRRDLDLLAGRGVVRRVRGGAMAAGPQQFAERFGREARAKEKVVRKLVEVIGEARAIGIDASSTLQRLAPLLPDSGSRTVLTNGPECFAALQEAPGVTALLTGGQLDRRTGSLVGPLATRAARDVALDVLLVSAAGVDPVLGSFETTLEEAEVKLALADVSRRVVLAVDHTKLDASGPARCLPLDRIDVVVTDLDPGDRRLEPFRALAEIR
jgi:DeoR family fructose operon transcriptional repressor